MSLQCGIVGLPNVGKSTLFKIIMNEESYENGDIVEAWKMSADKVLDIILPKIIKEYPKKNYGMKVMSLFSQS